MRTRVAYGLVLGLVIAALSGCGSINRPQREAWRGEVELACLKRGAIVPTSFTRPIKQIDGPGTCGLDHPFQIHAVSDGQVAMAPFARIGCPMAEALNVWMRDVVQPSAKARFGVEVAEIRNMASYGCRTRNNRRGARMSEHSYGNGLDIGGFVLTDGREVSVLKDWRRGPVEAQAFLREIHAGACGMFNTVLGPGSDRFHENHLHLDLARHRGGKAYCRPKPVQPEPAMVETPRDPYPAIGERYGAAQPTHDARSYGSAGRDGGYAPEDERYGAAEDEIAPEEQGDEAPVSYAAHPRSPAASAFGGLRGRQAHDDDLADYEGDE